MTVHTLNSYVSVSMYNRNVIMPPKSALKKHTQFKTDRSARTASTMCMAMLSLGGMKFVAWMKTEMSLTMTKHFSIIGFIIYNKETN